MQKLSSKAASTTIAKVNRDSQTLQHKGRVLGFAEYGPASGYPVFFFHGFPGSRIEGGGGEKEATARNIRLICPERPGYGLSSYQSSRQIIDWPEDVTALADHLRLDKFAVIGGSGGGPYALACAQKIPDRLTAVGVFAGAPPWYALPHLRKPWYWYLARAMSINTPGLYAWTLMRVLAITKFILRTTLISERMADWRGELSQEDFIKFLSNGFVQGPAAVVQETRLLSDNWGLELGSIKPEVVIWHGVKDTNAPIQYIRAMAEAIPNARLRETDDNHYTIGNHFAEYLDDLLPPSVRE
ncbi:hypothetical protein MRB53_042051 [Persea americana]|nr:hypothetical protein MRB53_042051 [Persea americana]